MRLRNESVNYSTLQTEAPCYVRTKSHCSKKTKSTGLDNVVAAKKCVTVAFIYPLNATCRECSYDQLTRTFNKSVTSGVVLQTDNGARARFGSVN